MSLSKKITVAFLALFLAAPAAAQGLPGFSSLGVKGGLSLGSLNTDGGPDFGYDAGFVGGIYGQVGFTPFISPRAELLYVQKGGSLNEGEDIEDIGPDQEASYNVDYLEIPVLAKVSVPVVRQILPSLYLGPYLSFAVNRSVTIDGEETDLIDGGDIFETTDYGLVVGTDVDFTFAGYGLVLSARYDWGLANVANTGDEDEDVDVSTSTFMITIGAGI